ncbi:type 1 glutamine amidotransferase [Candidatus Kaiserbacteria bacterium]|nr:type 1 glutamine amidotransferase [Candidatus Kaiserbacteria bacterium]
MEKEILIIKNITREGPGLLEELLKEKEINYTTVDLDRGEEFPVAEKYGAVVVLGGPDSANDDTEKMQKELRRIGEIIAAGTPYLGICLGLQTLVKASGGTVVKNAVREIGFRDPDDNRFAVERTEEGKKDPLFANLGDRFNVFHLHGETVELAEGMTLLGTGKFCRNQIVRVGANAYGIQCHFELTPEMFQTWLNEDPDLLALKRNQLEADFAEIKDEYTRVGRRLFSNFLQVAGF